MIVKSGKNFISYQCPDHGVYQVSQYFESAECPWCHSKNQPIQDIEQLQVKFRKELHLVH